MRNFCPMPNLLIFKIFRRILRITYKPRIYTYTLMCLFFLKAKNLFTRRTILDINSDVVVSLTTHGKRFHSVYLTIESIANGKLKPKKIILWIDDLELYRSIPLSLKKLQQRGLTISLTNNYGPHTKYYPYVKSINELNDEYLVTADDDILYPKYWLATLRNSVISEKKEIICYRAHQVKIKNNQIVPYSDWCPCKTNDSSFHNFATGVSGVIYSPEFQKILKKNNDKFLNICPKADDVWLHFIAIKNNYKIRQLNDHPIHFPIILNTQNIGLLNENVAANGNDIQIKKTYDLDSIICIKNSWNS